MISVEINNQAKCGVSGKFIKETIGRFFKYFGLSGNLEVSVALVDFKTIRRLNQTYRGKDRPTDILSFGGDLSNQPRSKSRHKALPIRSCPYFGGELIICYPQAKKQAAENGHGLKEELKVLLIHGLLHLLGYDHEKDGEARIMRALEKKMIKL